jgi:hypothetical protein
VPTPAATVDLANLGANGFRIDGAAVGDLERPFRLVCWEISTVTV